MWPSSLRAGAGRSCWQGTRPPCSAWPLTAAASCTWSPADVGARGCPQPRARLSLPILQHVWGGCSTHPPPRFLHRLPSHLAAAAALRRAHRGHHPTAAARLPRVPVAPWTPKHHDGTPRLASFGRALAHPKQTVKYMRDQPRPCPPDTGARGGGEGPRSRTGPRPSGTVPAAVRGWPQEGGGPASPPPHCCH